MPSIPFTNITPDKICGFLSGDNERLWAGEPKRGDVIVFRHPVHGTDYIKRLIGAPGDTVQMKDGRLILNGEEVALKKDGKFTEIMERKGPCGANHVVQMHRSGLVAYVKKSSV